MFTQPIVPMTPTVAAVSNLALDGTIIPANWYKTIKLPNGKPDLYAILFLAELVYWHTARVLRDQQSGQVLGYERKFPADKYQCHYRVFAEKFSLSLAGARQVMHRLLDLDLVTLELRTVEVDGFSFYNVPFWDLKPDVLRRFTFLEE
jgi:hypothetical protein